MGSQSSSNVPGQTTTPPFYKYIHKWRFETVQQKTSAQDSRAIYLFSFFMRVEKLFF